MFPKMVRIRQLFENICVDNLSSVMAFKLNDYCRSQGIITLAEKKIGITAGSRGIDSIPVILKTVAAFVKEKGGCPVIIPSMGSHGGGVLDTQIQILKDLGITDESTGASIVRNIATEMIGTTDSGVPVYVNKAVLELDGLIVVNRIKPHTDFHGSIESGICKMLAIGIGALEGAGATHSYALKNGYEETIVGVASKIMEKVPVIAAVGIIENCMGKTAKIDVFSADEIMLKEPLLLNEAKKLKAKLPVENVDVLVIDEIGKNISGTGMDTKVVGRIMVHGQKEPDIPKISRIVVLDVTGESHGNVLGIGLADITTKRVLEKTDFRSTAVNAINSMSPEQGRLPVVMDSDMEAIQAALRSLGALKKEECRIIHIKNTSFLEEMEVSIPVLEEIKLSNFIHIVGPMHEFEFDAAGSAVRV